MSDQNCLKFKASFETATTSLKLLIKPIAQPIHPNTSHLSTQQETKVIEIYNLKPRRDQLTVGKSISYRAQSKSAKTN